MYHYRCNSTLVNENSLFYVECRYDEYLSGTRSLTRTEDATMPCFKDPGEIQGYAGVSKNSDCIISFNLLKSNQIHVCNRVFTITPQIFWRLLFCFCSIQSSFIIKGFSLKVFCLICTNLAVFSSVLHLNMNVLSVAVFVYKSLINHATLETN